MYLVRRGNDVMGCQDSNQLAAFLNSGWTLVEEKEAVLPREEKAEAKPVIAVEETSVVKPKRGRAAKR